MAVPRAILIAKLSELFLRSAAAAGAPRLAAVLARLRGRIGPLAAISAAWPLGRTLGFFANSFINQPEYRAGNETFPAFMGTIYRQALANPAVRTLTNILGPFGPNFWLRAAYTSPQDVVDGWSGWAGGFPVLDSAEVAAEVAQGDILGLIDKALEFWQDDAGVDDAAAFLRGASGAVKGFEDLTGIPALGVLPAVAGTMTWLSQTLEGQTPESIGRLIDDFAEAMGLAKPFSDPPDLGTIEERLAAETDPSVRRLLRIRQSQRDRAESVIREVKERGEEPGMVERASRTARRRRTLGTAYRSILAALKGGKLAFNKLGDIARTPRT